MKLGWLCDSILKTAAKPSPMSTTPAFSPGPWMTRGPFVGRRRRCTREDLYEQCSLHMTLKTPSSVYDGVRPRALSMRAYSSGEILCCFRISGPTGRSPGKACGAVIGAVSSAVVPRGLRPPFAGEIRRRPRPYAGPVRPRHPTRLGHGGLLVERDTMGTIRAP